ncbi:dTMP kinase [Pontimonas sp.]|nr:dTMP kinase [Pontimonas sp.]
MAGLFVTFEGGDASGKTTQIGLLAAWLKEQGKTVVVTREPGGSDLGNELRDIVLHRRGFIAPRAEALIYAADRAHHIHEVVRPALERGEVVLQDRYLDSSVAYQGAGRVLDPSEVREVSLWATEGLMPDVTVLLDVPADIGLARQASEERAYDRLEAEALEFHERVRDSYLAIAQENPDRVVVIDGTAAIDEVHRAVLERVSQALD